MSAFSPVKISFSQYCICCYGWQECSQHSLNKDHISYWRVPFTSNASFSAVPYCTMHFSSPLTSLLHSISSNSSKLSFYISCHLPSNEKGGREQFSFSLHRLSMQHEKLSFLPCQGSQLSRFISVCPRIYIWTLTSCLHYPLSIQLGPGVEGWMVCLGWVLLWDQQSQIFWFLRVIQCEVCCIFFLLLFLFFFFPL